VKEFFNDYEWDSGGSWWGDLKDWAGLPIVWVKNHY